MNKLVSHKIYEHLPMSFQDSIWQSVFQHENSDNSADSDTVSVHTFCFQQSGSEIQVTHLVNNQEALPFMLQIETHMSLIEVLVFVLNLESKTYAVMVTPEEYLK
ncbi:MAG TPA: hypothetical protein VK068_01075 [Jeotgalicoccus sp.]|nr:hypothetical protein [Jeotgalicoccus sp.]